ncbi:MAG TPA: prolipoprotein diacylglyceryl transferase family protein [Streptosporangiaceae bacterium]
MARSRTSKAKRPAARTAPARAAGAKDAPAGLKGAKAAASAGSGAAGPAPAGSRESVPPAQTPDDVPRWAAKALAELLTVTCWVDPGESGGPVTATVSFSGRRLDVTGKSRPGDTFTKEETVEGILPGSGPVAVSAEVRDINPGEWRVTARPVARPGQSLLRPYPAPGGKGAAAMRVPPPRQVTISAETGTDVHTTHLLRTKVPGISRFVYPVLVPLSVLAGLGLEALLLITGHYPVLRPLLFSLAAVAAGVAGGKAWYIAVHRGRKRDGWCIQGFVAGAVAVVAAAAVIGVGIPAGVCLAVAGPALLVGMGIGRPACFWAGCCTGRPTTSRWGIWASDRVLGCRRAPAQLVEALTALLIGLGLLAYVLIAGLPGSGPAAAAGLAAYTLARQFILGMRREPRTWRHGRKVTAVIAAVALIVSVALLVRG